MEEQLKTEPVKKRGGRRPVSEEQKKKTRAAINKRYYEKTKKAREFMKEYEKQKQNQT